MRTLLERIVVGYHFDEVCHNYQQRHKRLFHFDAPPCKYKENPEELPKLLEKLVIVDTNLEAL